MMTTISIRQAILEDAPAIASLNQVLGRQDTRTAVLASLTRLLKDEREAIFVATLDSDQVVGWIHASVQEALGSGLRCEISGLVVDTKRRRSGVGRCLVETIEAWCKTRGLTRISVRSNLLRPESMPFYGALGYAQIKTQHIYGKTLNQES